MTAETIKLCTKYHVDNHYEAIRDAVQDTDETRMKYEMMCAVHKGTAFTSQDETCFLYVTKTSELTYTGVAFKGHDMPSVTLKMLYYAFRYSNAKWVQFNLHEGKSVKEYRSLLTTRSIIQHVKNGGPVKVDIQRILGKISKCRQ